MSGIESGDFPRLQARYRRQWWIWFAGCAVLTLVGVLAAGVYGIGMAVLSLIALPVVSAQLSKKLSRYYKSEIVPQFVGRFCDEGRYVPGAGIDEEVFRASNLFGAPPDRYATEDLIEGRVGKTVSVLRKSMRRRGGRRIPKTAPVPRGWIFSGGSFSLRISISISGVRPRWCPISGAANGWPGDGASSWRIRN